MEQAFLGQRFLRALRVFVLLLVGLHLAAPFFAESWAWGVWPANYLPPLVRFWGGFFVALLCVPSISRWFVVQISRLLRADFPFSHPQRWFLLAALVAMPVFWLFRLVHTRWGDAYILIHAISHPDPALRLIYTWQAPLTVFLQAQIWALGHAWWQWPAATLAYALTSVAAGGVAVFAALNLAFEVGRTRCERLLVAGFLLTLGTMQLFFGYVENYSLVAAGILVYLWLAARFLHGRAELWHVALALAICNALHPSTIYLLPSLLVLGFSQLKTRGWLGTAWHVAWPLGLVAACIFVLMTAGGHGLDALLSSDRPGGGDGRWLVPLFATSTRWEHYTMFSIGHLIDVVNQQLLTAPLSLPLALTALAFLRRAAFTEARSDGTQQPRWFEIFLAVAALGGLLFVFLWNPDYGGQRDWDLFSLPSFPLTLLAAKLMLRVFSVERQRLEAWVLITAASLFHTVAWIFQNTRPWEWPK